jgi:DNA primase large subunit
MGYVPSAKELSHFPFLKKSQEYIRDRFSSLDSIVHDKKSNALLERAAARTEEAISYKKDARFSEPGSPEAEIAAYALARIIVSCMNDRQVIDRLTRYEADRAYAFLRSEGSDEDSWNRNYKETEHGYSRLFVYIAHELGIPVSRDRIPFGDYVELVAPIHEERFRLVNRIVADGEVRVRTDEMYELLRERIRVILRRDLPHRVPSAVCEGLAPRIGQLKAAYQEKMLQQFGAIEESAFPPCMQALVSALTSGANLTHAGRFSLTTFLHAIGMDIAAIAGLYARSPDFDAEKTMYQVEHITGRGGQSTEYNTPACAAMRTTGLCIHRDPLCDRISHPLSYYKIKKKKSLFKGGKPTGKNPPSPPT